MNINAIVGGNPALFLTRNLGALLLFGKDRHGIIGDHWVHYRTGNVHFCHRDYKTQETALVATVSFN